MLELSYSLTIVNFVLKYLAYAELFKCNVFFFPLRSRKLSLKTIDLYHVHFKFAVFSNLKEKYK